MSEDLISRAALYERAVTLEAQALDYVGKLIERDGDEPSTEWRIWSAILNERTAFKHDVYNAPSAQPEQRWVPIKFMMPTVGRDVLVSYHFKGQSEFLEFFPPHDGVKVTYWTGVANHGKPEFAEMGENTEVLAWMPLPEPYREENE